MNLNDLGVLEESAVQYGAQLVRMLGWLCRAACSCDADNDDDDDDDADDDWFIDGLF